MSSLETTPDLYATRESVESVISQVGVDLRIDDNDNGTIEDGAGDTLNEQSYLDDAIEEATDEMNQYLLHRYSADVLCTSRWVQRRASYLAANILSKRRGNPEIFCDEVEEIHKELQKVLDGKINIPRLILRDNMLPTMSNLTVNRWHRDNQLRVDPKTSVGGRSPKQDMNNFPVG